MVSHNHPRFSDYSYDPCPMPVDSMLRAAYESAVEDDGRIYCEFTCSECGTEPVERIGMCCFRCRIAILDAAVDCEICGERPATTTQTGQEIGGEYDELRWMDYDLCDVCARKASRQ